MEAFAKVDWEQKVRIYDHAARNPPATLNQEERQIAGGVLLYRVDETLHAQQNICRFQGGDISDAIMRVKNSLISEEAKRHKLAKKKQKVTSRGGCPYGCDHAERVIE